MSRMLFVIMAVGLSVGCTTSMSPHTSTPAPAPDSTKTELQLYCSVTPAKPQFKVGEAIEVTLVIKNSNDAPVHAAFLARSDHPIVNFRVVDGDGKYSLISTKKALWCGTGTQNKAIAPGLEYQLSVDLAKIWQWGGTDATFPPGTYIVSAHLFSRTVNGGSPEVGKSQSITFEVIPSK